MQLLTVLTALWVPTHQTDGLVIPSTFVFCFVFFLISLISLPIRESENVSIKIFEKKKNVDEFVFFLLTAQPAGARLQRVRSKNLVSKSVLISSQKRIDV